MKWKIKARFETTNHMIYAYYSTLYICIYTYTMVRPYYLGRIRGRWRPIPPGHGVATEARATETDRDTREHHFMLLRCGHGTKPREKTMTTMGKA